LGAAGNEGVDEEQVVEDHFGHLLNSEDGLGKRKRQTPEDADEGDFGQDERAQEHEEEEDEEEGKVGSSRYPYFCCLGSDHVSISSYQHVT